MRYMPVIMYCYGRFQNPPFHADVTVSIDDVVDRKFEMLDCHVSRMYEWLPYTHGNLHQVPTDAKERLEWLHGKRIPRDGAPLSWEELAQYKDHPHSEYVEAVPAVKHTTSW